ncbi:TPA: CHASE sensor domain-containing protein, partial [Salmonella enterica]
MNKEFSLSRPTFKRTLRRISIISVLLTMTLIWLLICVASVLTLKQYAQKNLDLTAATMAHSLEAALVFSDNTAAAETLATLGRQGQFSAAEVRDKNGRIIASWRYDARAADDKLIGLISHWLFPLPVS